MKTNIMPNEITLDSVPEKPLIHNLDASEKLISKKTVIIGISIIVGGVISGLILSNLTKGSGTLFLSPDTSGTETKMVVGSSDTKVFRDSAEGILEAGGINGEGTHKLIRPGGESQNVYLTSSVLDLSQFVGKKVKVWGETFAAQQAGWLMDVGKVEVL